MDWQTFIGSRERNETLILLNSARNARHDFYGRLTRLNRKVKTIMDDKDKPVDAPPDETPVKPDAPGGPPISPQDDPTNPPEGQPPGTPVGPGRQG